MGVARRTRHDDRNAGLFHEAAIRSRHVPPSRARQRRQHVVGARRPVRVCSDVFPKPGAKGFCTNPALERGEDCHPLLVDESVPEQSLDIVEALYRPPDRAGACESIRRHDLVEVGEVIECEPPRWPIFIGDAVAEELSERFIQPGVGEPWRRDEGPEPLVRHLVRHHHRRGVPALLVGMLRVQQQQIRPIQDRARVFFRAGIIAGGHVVELPVGKRYR